MNATATVPTADEIARAEASVARTVTAVSRFDYTDPFGIDDPANAPNPVGFTCPQ